ncbi:MAG TPA: hypothetical protein VMX17_00705 [Candidatus Glassbacteria bacterium]|nr:hypothetical protein [Candidatus Glassbacteria bacterium]
MKPILAIVKGDDVFLPKKYHKINNLCGIIYDQLTELYNEKNYKDLFKTKIDFSPNVKFIQELKNGSLHVLDWLARNELNREIEMVITRRILEAMIHDFINFTFESMDCAKNGKMSVAYALLRKPFTDELLIFEQLLVNRRDFIDRLYFKGNPKDYDPGDTGIDKKRIIELAMNKLRINPFLSSDFIFELRYDKASEAGIKWLSNHALHIVTNDRNYPTSNQNMNFIFWDNDDMDYFYKHYYSFVPYLLIYAVSIIDELVFNLLTGEGNQRLKTVKEFRRLLGMLLFTEYIGGTKNEKIENNPLFKEILKKLVFKCSMCGQENRIIKSDCECFFETEEFYCKKCCQNLLTTKEAIEIIENVLNGEYELLI